MDYFRKRMWRIFFGSIISSPTFSLNLMSSRVWPSELYSLTFYITLMIFWRFSFPAFLFDTKNAFFMCSHFHSSFIFAFFVFSGFFRLCVGWAQPTLCSLLRPWLLSGPSPLFSPHLRWPVASACLDSRFWILGRLHGSSLHRNHLQRITQNKECPRMSS